MKHIDNIDKLYSQQISKEEKDRIEKSISADDGSKKEMEFVTDLHHAFAKKDIEEKVQFLKSIDIDKEAHLINEKRWLYISGVAASIAIVIGSFWFLNQAQSLDDVYMEHYEFYPSLDVMRSEHAQVPKDIEAYGLYNKGNFQESIALFETQDGAKIRFFHGLALMELGNYSEAILEFEKAQEAYTLPVAYYKALSYIKLNNKDAALQALKTSNKEWTPFYQNKTQKLLDILTQ